MHEKKDDLGGRKLARIVVRDRILDEASGHEFHTGKAIEAAVTFDGTEKKLEVFDGTGKCAGNVKTTAPRSRLRPSLRKTGSRSQFPVGQIRPACIDMPKLRHTTSRNPRPFVAPCHVPGGQ
jgi:hypothetical protein